jgi:predicted acylesterase/phospholipase RssA
LVVTIRTGILAPNSPAGLGTQPTFVLSGGGNLGALQVGMLQALVERGINAGLIVGTSIGAINGALYAGHPDLEGIAAIARLWRSLRRRHVLKPHVSTLTRGLLGASDYFFDSRGLEAIVDACVSFGRLEDAPIPLAVVATDVAAGSPVVLERGDTTVALLASSAVPRLFPPVRIGNRMLIDGASVADVPLQEALALGARDIYVLATTPLQVGRAIAHLTPGTNNEERPTIRFLTPPPVRVPHGDLRRSSRLIKIGYAHARDALARIVEDPRGDATRGATLARAANRSRLIYGATAGKPGSARTARP